MRSADVRAWTGKLRRAQRLGDTAGVVEALEALCRLEPDDARRWKALARVLVTLGRRQEAVAALVRAASLQTRAGAGIAAVATCRWILELDPMHTATLDRLAELQEANDAAAVPRRDERDRATTPPRKAVPTQELLLREVVSPTPAPEPDRRRERRPARPAARRRPGDDRATARGLVATPLFGRLGARSLRRLIEATRRVELAEGEVLFRQGDPADALFVVVEGAVVPIAEDAGRRRLSVLEAGAFFGEIALLTGAPRNATIEALVATELLAIDRHAITDLLDTEAAVRTAMLAFLRERLVGRLVGTSRLLAGLDRAETEQLIAACRLVEVPAGATLIEQGDLARALFLVLSGELRVVEQRPEGDREIARLAPGEPCGEMSLLDGAPAVARVDAVHRSWLLALPQVDFEGILRSHPRVERRLVTIAAERRTAP